MANLGRILGVFLAAWCLLAAARCLGEETDGDETPFFAGPLYSDNSGLRGYNMPLEPAEVMGEGKWGMELGTDAANYWTYYTDPYDRADTQVKQIFEIQSLAVNLRAGVRAWVPFEVSLRACLQQRNKGILNGFIEGTENMFYHMFGPNLKNPRRTGPYPVRENYNTVRINGHARELDVFSGPRLGDGLLTAKKSLLDSGLLKLSGRGMLNLPLAGEFSNGRYMGLGLAWDQPSPWQRLVFHLDGRSVVPFERENSYGLKLLPFSLGVTAGLEWSLGGLGVGAARFPKDCSLGIQVNSCHSPFEPQGLWCFDETQNDLTLGFSHGFKVGTLSGFWQVWAREDFMVEPAWPDPLILEPFSPPDFQAGIKLAFRE